MKILWAHGPSTVEAVRQRMPGETKPAYTTVQTMLNLLEKKSKATRELSDRSYVYQAAGRERVKTPAGEFDALKLVKRRDNPQDRATEIWLAADRNYIPVKVLIVDKDGTRIEQLAVRIAAQ